MSEDLHRKDATVPAPWTLKAQFWAIFVLSSHPTKSAFPFGWATSGEADALAEGGEFIGGMGFVMVRLAKCQSCLDLPHLLRL